MSTVPKPLLGVVAKLSRARDHLKDIDAIVERWKSAVNELGNTIVGSQYQPDVIELILPKCPPVDENLPLIIGDYVHNLRSALDHLAKQLAALDKKTNIYRQLSFPIFATQRGWKDKGISKIKPFVCDKAFEAVKREQPYHALEFGKDPLKRILWVLQELDDIDKHRVIVVVSQQMRQRSVSVTLGIGGPTVIVPTPDEGWRQLEDGATVARVNLAGLGAFKPSEVRVKVDGIASLRFADTGLVVDNMTIAEVLPKLFNETASIIRRFELEFFPSSNGLTAGATAKAYCERDDHLA